MDGPATLATLAIEALPVGIPEWTRARWIRLVEANPMRPISRL